MLFLLETLALLTSPYFVIFKGYDDDDDGDNTLIFFFLSIWKFPG